MPKKTKTKTKTTNNPINVRMIQRFLDDSINDYIAARVLFLNNLPHQAAVLSSTAIEKALKVILAFKGNVSHGHLKKGHLNSLRNFDPNVHSKINQSFIELNQKAYDLRYTETLPSGYNIVIASREYLAELDNTILSILPLFKQKKVNGVEFQTNKLDNMLTSNDPRLLNENFILNNLDKEYFIYSKPQAIYEFRNNNGNILEAIYFSNLRPIDKSFLRKALNITNEKENSLELSHHPLDNSL